MMKALSSAVVLFFLFSVSLFAQKKEFKPELYIGVGGGALMSQVDFLPNVPQKQQIGIHGGVSARFISQEHLGVQLEINYAQRGWTESFSDAPDFSYHRNLHYVEIPLMTHVYFGKKVRFIIHAGPQLGFLLGNSAVMSDALQADIDAKKQQNPDRKIGMQYSSQPRKFDYGLLGGIGMEFTSPIGNFELEGRYHFGLGDIFENRKTKEDFYFGRSANRGIIAKISYYFKMK